MAFENAREIRETLKSAEITKQERDDLSIFTVEIPGHNRSIDVEAKSEDEARQKATKFLEEELEREQARED